MGAKAEPGSTRISFMAIQAEPARVSEHGLSLIEALVMVTITALLALLLLPLVSSAAGRNFGRAATALNAADAANAANQFRALMRAASQARGGRGGGLEGDANTLIISPALEVATACADAGGGFPVRLKLEQRSSGQALVCESASGRSDILSWSEGAGAFSYSEDGVAWRGAWSDADESHRLGRGAAPPTRRAPLVRFAITTRQGEALNWIERAGAAEIADQTIDPSAPVERRR